LAPTAGPGGPSPLDALVARSPVAAELSALLRDTADTAAALMTAHAPPPVPHRPVAPARRTVRVSTDAMPYLLDHCFFPQRPGWPDLADRWPVVPATTIVQHVMDAAADAARAADAGRAVPVAVHGARFEEWLTAAPAVDVPVTLTPEGADRLTVSFGPRARATVELAGTHPAPPPAPWAA
ncbi:beta-ketoacyl synthase, partial [Streptomyces sp. ID05-04B]|nr:beta-ketoacyl synthase [Streptomyces sp. ID05-04B]